MSHMVRLEGEQMTGNPAVMAGLRLYWPRFPAAARALHVRRAAGGAFDPTMCAAACTVMVRVTVDPEPA